MKLWYVRAATAVDPGAIVVATVAHLFWMSMERRDCLLQTNLVWILSLAVLGNDTTVVGHQETVVVQNIVRAFQLVRLIHKAQGKQVAATRGSRRCIRWTVQQLGNWELVMARATPIRYGKPTHLAGGAHGAGLANASDESESDESDD